MKMQKQSGKRILSLWLPQWPTDRLYRVWQRTSGRDWPSREQPLVLSVARQGGQQVGAANNVALASGIRVGMMLTDAQALISGIPGLAVHDLTPERDDKALASLADWCSRYSPWVASDNKDGDYGICLDVTGCAHLFGGEASMLDDISRRLRDFSIQAQILLPIVSEQPGLSHAMAGT